MLARTEEPSVVWLIVAPGKQIWNGISEALNSEMRDELLSETSFFVLDRPRRHCRLGQRLQRRQVRYRVRIPDPRRLRRPLLPSRKEGGAVPTQSLRTGMV